MSGESSSDPFPWEKYFKENTTPYNGYVTDAGSLKELLAEYERSTVSKFRMMKSTKNFGQDASIDQLSDVESLEIRFYDTQKTASPYITYDGVPFSILGKRMLECHHGYDRDLAKKKKRMEVGNKETDHSFIKRRRLVQDSKKKNCNARIRLRHILKYPGFKVNFRLMTQRYQYVYFIL